MNYNKTLISLLCCMFLCGCDAKTLQHTTVNEQYAITQKEDDFTNLTDRQKNILELMKLPTDYEQLNYTQQHAIKRIEIMLHYLEEKYEMEFSYAGYVPAGVMESEHLTAYPTAEGTGDGANFVIVKPYGETFKDNYSDKEIREYYECLVSDFIREYFQSEQAVFIDYRFSTSLNDISEVSDGNFHYKASTETSVFVSDIVCDEAQIKTFADAMKLWFEEHKIISRSRVSLIYGEVTNITRDNFSDYYNKTRAVENGDYQIIIHGGDIEQNTIELLK